MAVLIEAISVVIQLRAVQSKYPGGWSGFAARCPNRTLCADGELARVGFMSPVDVDEFVRHLESLGLQFQRQGKAIDLAVVDQRSGPTTDCDWLQFGTVAVDGHRVAACWATGSEENQLMTPDGWRFENSLSARFGFVAAEAVDGQLEFLRHERGVDVYLNRVTGKEVYVGRASGITPPPGSDETRGGGR
jgi:hypothetical protein